MPVTRGEQFDGTFFRVSQFHQPDLFLLFGQFLVLDHFVCRFHVFLRLDQFGQLLLQLFHGIVVIQIDGVVVLRRFRFPLIIIRFLGSLHALPHLVPDFLPIVPVRFPMHGLSHRDYACHGFGLPETLFGLLSRIVCKLTVSVRSCLLSFFSVHRFLF